LVLLALYAFVHGGVFVWIVCGVVAVWFFYSESVERRSYTYSYGVYLLLLFLYGINIEHSLFADIIFFCLVVLLLSLWVGLTRFIFKEKERVADLYHCVLVFFLILFALLFPSTLSAVFVGIGAGLLIYEYLSLHKFPWKQRITLVSVAGGLFLCETLLIVRALSLHSIVLAGVVTLVVLVIRNLYVAHFSGTLTREYLFQNITIFVVVCIILFATGKWVF